MSLLWSLKEQAGSDAVLVYDGTGVPDVRAATIENLVPDMSYSFKVAPLTAIGDGVLSGASTTVYIHFWFQPLHIQLRLARPCRLVLRMTWMNSRS